MNRENISETLNKILPLVKMPGRYTGGEFNQIQKDWSSVDTRIALLFPEIYDLGMSNLGLLILYDLVNQDKRFLAERSFVPWTDMEDLMREFELPLYTLESKRPLLDFDIIGVSLPYESLYTNFLNALDLAGIPQYARDRDEGYPLIIAGGHAAFNPEPVAPFIDIFVIGEGEEALLEILDSFTSLDPEISKHDRLMAINQIPGTYVPDFYEPSYHEDGSLAALRKNNPKAPDRIQKRIVGKLPPPPLKPIVPYIDTVHNRAPLEIMRGCTRGCRFCQAGMVTRPVRERTTEEILDAMEKLIPNTGYSEIGLLSLSSSDYTQIIDLVKAINERFSDQNISVSLPSLRIESVSVDLMDALAGKRRGGFTLAPEAATERLRAIINKPISDQQLLDTSREIYEHGWQTIKLYFMIGHPGETLEDVQAIADLSKKVLAEGKRAIGGRAKVHTSVSTFVPKPHTPFQWVGTTQLDEIQEKLELLQNEVRGKGLKLNWNKPEETHFESWFSRGDRRLGEVLQKAWEKGAKFDAWQEHFSYDRWKEAFQETGFDPEFYSTRKRSTEEVFPWDHIENGVKKSFLLQEYLWSQEGKLRPDCREDCFSCGILPTYNDLRSQNPGSVWLCPEVKR